MFTLTQMLVAVFAATAVGVFAVLYWPYFLARLAVRRQERENAVFNAQLRALRHYHGVQREAERCRARFNDPDAQLIGRPIPRKLARRIDGKRPMLIHRLVAELNKYDPTWDKGQTNPQLTRGDRIIHTLRSMRHAATVSNTRKVEVETLRERLANVEADLYLLRNIFGVQNRPTVENAHTAPRPLPAHGSTWECTAEPTHDGERYWPNVELVGTQWTVQWPNEFAFVNDEMPDPALKLLPAPGNRHESITLTVNLSLFNTHFGRPKLRAPEEPS